VRASSSDASSSDLILNIDCFLLNLAIICDGIYQVCTLPIPIPVLQM